MRSRSAAATATARRANMPICAPPAAPRRRSGTNLELIRNEDGRRRFEWIERDGRRVLIQRSIVDPNLEWEVSQVRDSTDSSLPPCEARGDQATPGPCFNLRSARAKLMSRTGAETGRFVFGDGRARQTSSPIPTTRWPASPATCQLDDELRRLPPADRGEQPHHDPPL